MKFDIHVHLDIDAAKWRHKYGLPDLSAAQQDIEERVRAAAADAAVAEWPALWGLATAAIESTATAAIRSVQVLEYDVVDGWGHPLAIGDLVAVHTDFGPQELRDTEPVPNESPLGRIAGWDEKGRALVRPILRPNTEPVPADPKYLWRKVWTTVDGEPVTVGMRVETYDGPGVVVQIGDDSTIEHGEAWHTVRLDDQAPDTPPQWCSRYNRERLSSRVLPRG